MHITQIDFSAAPGAGRLGLMLLTVGAIAAATAVVDDSRRSDTLLQLQERHERLDMAINRSRPMKDVTAAPVNPLLSQSAQATARLAAPWNSLLDSLEAAQKANGGVALLGIEPDNGRGRLRVSGEAKDFSVLVNYMRSLDAQGNVADLRLLSQQTKQDDPHRPVMFQIEAKWGKENASSMMEAKTSAAPIVVHAVAKGGRG